MYLKSSVNMEVVMMYIYAMKKEFRKYVFMLLLNK